MPARSAGREMLYGNSTRTMWQDISLGTMDHHSSSTWLPEPLAPDDTYARRDEQALDWLARSTITRAKACRRFLNEHLSKLPVGTQSKILHDLRYQWHSTFFELIVARFLQELGASLVFESSNREGRRPDFTAQFSDGAIIVEAKAPVFNAAAGEEQKSRTPLLDFIESKIPEGWTIGIWQLPNIGPADSKREFHNTVEKMLHVPPPRADDEDRELIEELPNGIIHLHLWPKRTISIQVAWEVPITVCDNSEDRIRHTVKGKRSQVRSSDAPVLLAIQASGISSEFEDFDMALFGRGYNRFDERRQLVKTGFVPDGIFNEKRDETPTFAGILAFLTAGFNACTAPVLYHHPRFSGILPKAILQLEQRMYKEESQEIQIQPSNAQGLVERLNFVNV
jgi:hypothetical protein